MLRLDGSQYVDVASLGPGDTLATPLLPGFVMPLDKLFPGACQA